MRDRRYRRLPSVIAPPEPAPGSLDETVVHDPDGRPWLVCTSDTRLVWAPAHRSASGLPQASGDTIEPDGLVAVEYPAWVDVDEAPPGPYETQVFYTARAGIRGFPTGHGQRYPTRPEAVAGHRHWCLCVRTGVVAPDAVPDRPLG